MRNRPVVTMAAVVLAIRDTPGISSHELADFFGCSVKAIRSHCLRAGRESHIRNAAEAGPAAWVPMVPADDEEKAEKPVQRIVPAAATTPPKGLGPRSVWECV